MRRNAFLLKGIDKSMLGMEIAPWFNPVVSKADGYNVRTLDVFDHDTLVARVRDDPLIDSSYHDRLEHVDYVGSATDIAALVDETDHGRFDYVLSSHNFEHLPNPIKFLQGCERILKPGGTLVMAVPDGRACFDYLRPHTVIADWLEAYLEDRDRPSPRQIFAYEADFAELTEEGARDFPAIFFSTPPDMIRNRDHLVEAWAEWRDDGYGADYRDAHCSVFTPASLQLLIADCRALGLISFRTDAVSDTRGVEFMIRLTRPEAGAPSHAAEADQRTALMKQVWQEHSVRHAGWTGRPSEYVERKRKARLPWLYALGWTATAWLRNWNRRRRMRRKGRAGGT